MHDCPKLINLVVTNLSLTCFKLYPLSIITGDFPEDKDYIRLLHARGGWILSKIVDKKTLVVDRWNGDMRGDFPKWAYTKAWTK